MAEERVGDVEKALCRRFGWEPEDLVIIRARRGHAEAGPEVNGTDGRPGPVTRRDRHRVSPGMPTVRKALTPRQQTAWVKHGFSPDDAVEWKRAGFTPAAARPWHDAGFAATDAAAWRSAGGPYTDPRDACDVLEVLDMHTFTRWRSAGFETREIRTMMRVFPTLADAHPWLPLLRGPDGHNNLTMSKLWTNVRDGRLTADEVLHWCKETRLPAWLAAPLAADVDLETAKRLLARVPAPGPLADALAAGLTAGQILALADDGFDHFGISAWLRTGLAPARWHEMRACGLDPSAITDLVTAGATDADEMLEWFAQGFSPSSAGAYRDAGLTPTQARIRRRRGVQPADLVRLRSSEPPQRRADAPLWTEVFAEPRGRAPVYAVHRHLNDPDRLWTALSDLGAARAKQVSLFDHAYFGWAFLDGGFARFSPYGLNGPERGWVVGRCALALLCNRAGLSLPRTGRHRDVEDPDELGDLWERQRREASQALEARAKRLLVDRREQLEAEARTSNTEWEKWRQALQK